MATMIGAVSYITGVATKMYKIYEIREDKNFSQAYQNIANCNEVLIEKTILLLYLVLQYNN